jgi:lysophospholipase L1-like esterase
VTKKRGAVLVVLVLLAGAAVVLGFGYYRSRHGASTPPPPPTAPAPAPPAGGGTGRYAALGDSYTSAPNTGDPAGPPPGCGRSANNYPHLVAAAIRPAEFTDVSCGGATTAEMTRPQPTGNGTNPPQLDAVTPETTLVTVGIGGNDVGFVALAAQCTTDDPSASPCRDRLVTAGGDEMARRIETTGRRVAALLDQIHARAPRARVVLVGYPTILPDGGGCWPTLPLGTRDVAYLREGLARFNGKLAEVARAHRTGFADTATPGKGHDMCSPPDVRWVEGLVPATPAMPLHPNARGERGMADTVLTLLR